MSDEYGDLAELYHENTKIPPYELGLDGSRLPPRIDPGIVGVRFPLPRHAPGRGLELEMAIDARVSCRAFDAGAPLPLALVSRLCAFSAGFTTPFQEESELEFRRAAPSAGATYPIHVHAIVFRVAGIPPGVYRYALHDHSLELLREGLFPRSLAAWTLDQPYVGAAGVVFALTGCYENARSSYGERGYRYLLLEAGHIVQNLCLLSTAHGLGSLAIGGFVDQAVNRLLGVDEARETALYLAAVGVPGGGDAAL